MKFKKVTIKGYKSIGPSVNLEALDSINIFVGENNIGKTNILHAIDLMGRGGQPKITRTDFNKNKIGSGIKIIINVHLNSEELDKILGDIFFFYRDYEKIASKIKEEFGNELIMERVISKEGDLPVPKIKMAGITIWNGFLSTDSDIDKWSPRTSNRWNDFLNYRVYDKGDTITNMIKKLPKNQCVEVDTNSSALVKYLFSNFEYFLDVRVRPVGTQKGGYITGSETGILLQDLKNSQKDEERERWLSIKKQFSKLFPDLMIESVKGNAIQIKDKAGYKGLQDSVGMGIVEMIIMISNLIGRKNCVFAIEEPETHLHPIAQRLLWEIIEEGSKDNQFFIVTHSPYFIDKNNAENNIKVIKTSSGNTKVIQLIEHYFSQDETSKLSIFLSTSNNGEVFFARKVLLVEEPTASIAMPIFSQKLNKNFYEKGIYTLSVDGKSNFYIPMKLLKGLNIPFTVMCDKDALMNIETSINVGKNKYQTSWILKQMHDLRMISSAKIKKYESNIILNTKGRKKRKFYKDSIFNQLQMETHKKNIYVLDDDFEGVLRNAGHTKLLADARKKYNKSKPRIAHYVALVINKENIPQQFIDVITHISKKKVT